MGLIKNELPRIAFNAIFELTETYFQISKELDGKADCFFITPDIYTFKRLLSYGVQKQRILNLSTTKAAIKSLPPFAKEDEKKVCEYETAGPSFASLITMSQRFYRNTDARHLYRYIGVMALKLGDFFSENNINLVIAEPTTAPEILSYSVCKVLGIEAANIAIIRHPVGRCAIFGGIGETHLFQLTPEKNPPRREDWDAWLRNYREHGELPLTFEGQAKRRSPFSLFNSFLKRSRITFQELIGTNQLNYTNFPVQAEIFSRRYRSVLRKTDNSFNGKGFDGDPRPYAVFFLHVQPERTVDVMCPCNSNQLEVIRQLRMGLPSSIKLVVKDHPSSYGVQPPAFYKGLSNIPDVSLIDSRQNSSILLKNALCAITITGTVGMEAALMDIPAVVLSDVYFSNMPNVIHLDIPSRISYVLPQILNHKKGVNDDKIIDYIYELVKYSHSCDWDTLGGWKNKNIVRQIADLIMRVRFTKGN